jgi:hypothetical protein
MFFERTPQNRKPLAPRRLTLEHLENRALLSACPVASQLAGTQAFSLSGGVAAYSSKGTAAVATQLYLISQPVIQSGVQTTVQMLALDSSGRVVRSFNDTVSLSSSDSTATLPASVTFHNGQASFSVTFKNTAAENPTITATDSSVTPNLVGKITPIVTAPDVATSYYATLKSTVESGVQTTVHVYALDASGNVVRNYNGTASLTSTDSAAKFPTSITFHSGQASFKVTFGTSGTQSITVADSKAGLSTMVSTNVTAPAAVSLYSISLRSRVQSGVPVTVQVRALDASGHIVPGYTGTATITSSDTGATLPTTAVTFENGIATFTVTFATVGVQTITATDANTADKVPAATVQTDVVSSLNPSPTPPTSSQATTSTNWSGYAAATSLKSSQTGSVSAVSGSWTVPAVTGSGTGYSAVWVGIDGYQSSTVEQIGTSSDISNGVATYYAWYEMYPNASTTIAVTSLKVAAGDKITASVQYAAGAFVLTITDGTQSFTTSQTVANPRESSAEWIVEAPSSNAGVLPLANFGTVTFTNATATINGVTGAIDDSSWKSTAINMVSSRNALEALTSALTDTAASTSTTPATPASSSFTVTFESSGGSPTSPFPGRGGSGSRKANVAAAVASFNSNGNSGGSQDATNNQLAALDALFATELSFRG